VTRQRRGYLYPLPIDGYPLIDVCFQMPDNPYYRAAVRGALHQLTYYYSWWNDVSGPDLQQRWDVARIFLNLLNDTLSIGEGCAVQLQVRTNPENACVLDYSPDGGDNWYQFADVTDCPALGGDSYTTIIQLNLSQTTIYETIYDGTPTSINPSAPTGTWDEGGDPDRDAALCMAAMSLVGSIAAQELQALTERYIGSALIFAALFILTGGFAAFGVLIVGTLIAGVSYTAARAALEDREAQLAVACCMFDGLKSQPVTQVAFAASLGSCGFVGGTNAAIVRDFIDRSIQAETTYFAMVDSAGKAYVQAAVLGINLCECGDCGILTFDNPASDLSYTLEYGSIGTNGNPAQCLHAGVYSDPPFPNGRKSTIELELLTPLLVNKVSWDAYVDIEGGSGGNYARTVEFRDELGVLIETWQGTIMPTKMEWFNDNLADTPVPLVKYVKINLQFVCACPGTLEIRSDNLRVFCA
jgi:hypothetical protein